MDRMVNANEARSVTRHGHSPEFMVKQRSDGRWIAVELDGPIAGVFPSQHAAMTYAGTRTHHRRGSIRLVLAPFTFGR
ncbi:hypothetical protein SAMN04487843_12681 [Methylobacterium sp. ap11]|jgi:hypothetical protein|uniref:hypothetical protein n=1 Tax=Methylobacterium sp. ap11 TaxID=1761799 RepID=UPI0008AE7FFB|nr:hypothetical protein [Methylobacterium sp. ap11]SEP48205.1 hypothetical protein SAMN04487843_12681 [Methylobacterium sp. ap11]